MAPELGDGRRHHCARASTCTRWGELGDTAAELSDEFGPLGRRLIVAIGAGGLHAALAGAWRGVARE